MGTITCQQVQQQGSSCLEPHHVVEPRTTLSLKLSPSPSSSSIDQPQKCHFATTKINSAPDFVAKGGWSFLQSLSSSSSLSKPVGEEPAYVHPLAKRSSSTVLSEKSLQLCTENLGNETGTTDTADCGILSNTWRAGPDPGRGRGRASAASGEGREVGGRRSAAARGREGRRSFPPPLTTLSGKDSVRVGAHREGGRLVVTAVKGQSGLVSRFRADRSEEGRLRLCLVENCSPNLDSRGSERESLENDTKEEEEEREGEVEKEEEGESEKVEGELGEKERGEMGIIEKFGIGRGRCKEGGEQQYISENKCVLNWEPFWVAT